MIKCEIEKLNEDKGKTTLEIEGESNLLLNELRAIVTALFMEMAEGIPPGYVRELMMDVLVEGMEQGIIKTVTEAGEK